MIILFFSVFCVFILKFIAIGQLLSRNHRSASNEIRSCRSKPKAMNMPWETNGDDVFFIFYFRMLREYGHGFVILRGLTFYC